MVFSSPTFLFLFLPLVLLATWLAPNAARRFLLLGSGIVFYAWGVQEFVLVVLGSTLVDWALALGIARELQNGRRRAAKGLMVLGVVQNVGLLAWFKYADHASVVLDRLASFVGDFGNLSLSIALPIGISFFTFEKISYLVDVYRGDVRPRRDPTDVLLFVSLFPRSIAGPIVRLREIERDLRCRRPRPEQVQAGAVRFSYGLGKKVLVADQLAPIADAAFASAADGTLTGPAAWLGILAYTLQLYFDFSGYSDMAIGIGMMLGFRFPENFQRPYSAVSLTDFWRRWHMTLTRWFRDYVYIPLGGNRHGALTTYRNLLLVFGLTGLWHGAAPAFVLWGLYHGFWLLVERRLGLRSLDGVVRFRPGRRALTFLIVAFGWVLFRAGHLDLAATYYRALLDVQGGLPLNVQLAFDHQALLVLLVAVTVVLLPARQAGGEWASEGVGRLPALARVATMAVVLPLSLTLAFAGTFSPFLYFRF